MGPGALHQFTNGSQTRRRAKRESHVLRTLRTHNVSLSAAALASAHKETLRTMQRTLENLVRAGDVSRATHATAAGIVVLYRAVDL